MDQVSSEVAPQVRRLRVGIAHAEIVSDILSVVPNMALADVRFLSAFQIAAYLRLARIRQTRARIDALYTQHAHGDSLSNDWKALHRDLADLLYEPAALPDKAAQQQREYEERKRRGETFGQRMQAAGRQPVNPPPARGRFSIRKGAAGAGANHGPRRILNAELPKGIRGL